jgi:D-aspartate ligase
VNSRAPLPKLDKTVPVLIFKTGDYVLHHGTLGIVRSLGKLGVPVYAIVEDPFSPVAMSRYLAGAFARNSRLTEPDLLLATLADIRNDLQCPTVLIPTDDAAAVFVAEHAAILEKSYLLPPVPNNLPRQVSNKKELHSLCKSVGEPCPEIVCPSSIDDVRNFIRDAVFPVVVKTADSRRRRGSPRTTLMAQNPSELLDIYVQLEDPERPNVVFQEYIPQQCAEDWIVHGYCNPQSGCCLLFTGKKLRSFPPFAGITTLGVLAANGLLRRQAEKLLTHTRYAGVLDLDYRLDKRDGQYKLLDFNPRVGANFRMFEDAAGVDVVRALHLDLTNRTHHPSPMAEHRVFIVESYDLFATLSYMRHDGLTICNWWQTLKGRKEFAWFSLIDPLPFVVMCIRLFLQTMTRRIERVTFGARKRVASVGRAKVPR